MSEELVENIEQAAKIEQVFELCSQIDAGKLREVIRLAEKQETVGMLTMSPLHYQRATKQNRRAVEKTKALINLIEALKEPAETPQPNPGESGD